MICGAFTCCFTDWISSRAHDATSTLWGYLSSAGSCFCSAPHYSLESVYQCQPLIPSPSALWPHPVCYPSTSSPLLEGTAKPLHYDRKKKNNSYDKRNKMAVQELTSDRQHVSTLQTKRLGDPGGKPGISVGIWSWWQHRERFALV